MKFHLIPVDERKRPLTPHGEKDASPDKARWDEWKKQFPRCGWAIATGPSDLIAVDEDCYKAAFTAGALEHACGIAELPDTVEWKSARGGRVRLYRRGGAAVPARTGLVPAVDVKASTGYVVCPPSRNAEGQRYEWVRPPSTSAVADAPAELVRLILEHKETRGKGAAKPRRTVDGVEQVFLTSGDGRWEFLRRIGGVLRREGCGEQVLLAALCAFADHQCEPDGTIEAEEIERMVRWLVTVPVGADARLEEELLQEGGRYFAVTADYEKKGEKT